MKRTPIVGATPMDDQKAKMIIDRYELARTFQFPFWNDFDRYYKLYESYVNEQKEIWNTKIFVPMVFSVIERYLPRVLGNRPTVNYMARQGPYTDQYGVKHDTVKLAQTNQGLFEWEWDQVSRIKEGGMYIELLRFAKDAFVIGTGLAKIPWIKINEDTKGYSEKGEVQPIQKKVFDGPDFEVIDPYDFFFDPEASDIQRASWVIHRTRKTLQDMKDINAAKGVEVYKNLDIVAQLPVDNMSATENDYKMRRKTALGSGQVLVTDRTVDKYELMECWGWYPEVDKQGTKTGNMEKRVIVLANRSTIVRDIPYPYWHGKKPFIKYTPIPRTFDFYGVPIIKHLERLQWYMNEFVDQKFDNQVMSLNQMLVVDPMANVEDWQLVWRPGGVVRANPEHIKPLTLGDVTAPIDTSVAYLSQVSQLTTGLSDYYTSGTGAQETQNKTATGTNAIEQQIADRVNQMTQILEEQVIKEIGYQWHGLNQQFIRLPMIIRVVGEDGKPDWPVISPQDVRMEFDIVPEAGSTQPKNKDLLRQQFQNNVALVSKVPPMAQLTDWNKVTQESWKILGYKDFDQFTIQTAGSTPQGVMGGMPSMPPGMTGSQSVNPQLMQGQLMGGAAQGFQPGQMQGQAYQQGPQSNQAPKSPGTVSTKFEDLTLQEQEQWLAKLGISADTISRLHNMQQTQQQDQAQRGLDLIQKFQAPPVQNQPQGV